MQVLIESNAIECALIALMRSHDRYRWAVAWASTGFDAWKTLERHKERISQIVIGTHFHQTHPDAIASLHGERGVRFVTDLSGVFHHKIYLFEKDDGSWSAVIGSANFTNGAFTANDESAVIITSKDPGADTAKLQIDQAIKSAWNKATDRLTPDWLRWYTQMWEQKQERLRELAGRFGRRQNVHKAKSIDETEDGGRPVGDIPLLTMSWSKYLGLVRQEGDGGVIQDRTKVLESISAIFMANKSFHSMNLDDRNRVAGTIPKNSRLSAADKIDWAWFGRMSGMGKYNRTIIESHAEVSKALDCIPLIGTVDREMYEQFVDIFMRLPGTGKGNATRLLAMKRPDVFVCVNGKNAKMLKRWLGFRGQIEVQSYWESVIRRIQQAVWWNAPCPTAGIGRRVWNHRAAMLDAISYDHG